MRAHFDRLTGDAIPLHEADQRFLTGLAQAEALSKFFERGHGRCDVNRSWHRVKVYLMKSSRVNRLGVPNPFLRCALVCWGAVLFMAQTEHITPFTET